MDRYLYLGKYSCLFEFIPDAENLGLLALASFNKSYLIKVTLT